MRNKKFRRAKYNKEVVSVKNIYPKGWFLIVFLIELFLSLILAYCYRVIENVVAVTICMMSFYIIAIGEFAFRYKMKDKYYKNGYCMGANTLFYHSNIRLFILINIGMALMCFIYVVIRSVSSVEINVIYDNYWIWFALILFLLCFEPLNNITSGFLGNSFLTDRYVVDFSEISEIRIVNEKITTKGIVYEIEMYKNELKVGVDRVFEDDFYRLKGIILNRYR